MSESIGRTPPVAPPADVPRVAPDEPAGPRARRREPGPRRDPPDSRRAPPTSELPADEASPDGSTEPGKGQHLDVRV